MIGTRNQQQDLFPRFWDSGVRVRLTQKNMGLRRQVQELNQEPQRLTEIMLGRW